MSFDDFKRKLHDSDTQDTQDNRDYDNPHFTDMMGDVPDFTKNLDKPKTSNSKSKIVSGVSDIISNRRYNKAHKRETRMEKDRGTLSEQDFHMKYANQGLAGKITIGIIILVTVISVIMKFLL